MTVLPKGIRRRGNGFHVEDSYQGQRRTWTATTLEQAKERKTLLRASLVSGLPHPRDGGKPAKKGKGWTVKRAYQEAFNLHWAGTKSEAIMKTNGRQVLGYFGADTLLNDIKTAADEEDDEGVKTINGFVQFLIERGDANGTINRKLACLSKFFTVAEDARALHERPKIPRRKEPKGRIRFITEEEEQAALDAVLKWEFYDLWDACCVLLDTGIRRGELAKIEVRDIVDGVLTVWETKSGQPRSVPLASRAVEILARRSAGMAQRDRLFSMQMHELAYQWSVIQGGLPFLDDVTFHVFRHTFASRLVQRGVNIVAVQKLLGHSSIVTTRRYAHLAPHDLVSAIQVLEKDTKTKLRGVS